MLENPQVRIFYSNNDTAAGLDQVLVFPVPPEVFSEPYVRWGFTAVSVTASDFKGELTVTRQRAIVSEGFWLRLRFLWRSTPPCPRAPPAT